MQQKSEAVIAHELLDGQLLRVFQKFVCAIDDSSHFNYDNRNVEGSLVFDGQKKLVGTLFGGEIGIALGVAILLVCAQLARTAWDTLPSIGNPWGWALIGFGVTFSAPTAVLYHVRLAQSLRPRGLLDKHWIWHPTRLHDLLTVSEKKRVLFWFRIGALGWSLAIVGCVVVAWSMLA